MVFPRSILVCAVLAATALPAGVAEATPHWSSPKQVIAPPADPATQFEAAPEVHATPAGGLVAFATDGTSPVALSGTIAGGFGAPVKLATTKTNSVSADVGADGTAVAAWTDNNQMQVAIAPPGAGFGAPIAIPGTGVNTLDAVVASDGAVTVAYRTKSPQGIYEVHAITAPKGGGFGADQTLDGGPGGVSSISASAGPSGSVAVTWLRISGVYRTRVSVRGSGAALFDAPQYLSTSAKADLSPQVAFDADGTVIAAWANPDGAQVAVRPPGVSQFGPPALLGQPAFALDLVPTPQGSTALTLAGAQDIFAGLQSGSGFAIAPVGSAKGNQPPLPQIAVDASGAPIVVYADSASGEIRAVAGGKTTVIGYAKPGTVSATAVATVGAGKAVALWHDAQDGISAATFGEDAPPATGPPAKPGPADKTAPKLKLLSSKRVSVTSKTKTLRLTVSCNEPCAVGAQSDMRTTYKAKKRVAPLPYVDYKKAKPRSGRQTLTLKLNAGARKDLQRALKAKRGAQVFVRFSVADAAANVATTRATLTLRAASAKKKT